MKRKKELNNFHNNFKNKTIIIFIMAILVSFIFSVRIIWLYNSEYKDRAYAQQLKTVEIPAERGNIQDFNGKILAENIKTNALYFFPEYIEDENKVELANSMKNILDLNSDDIDNILNSKKTYKVSNYLKKDQVEKINGLKSNSLVITTENRRYYPGGSALSYILGFVDGDGNGVYGIEKYYNDLLKGKSGINIRSNSKNENSILFKDKESIEAISGKNIKLNIDENINTIVSNVAKEAFDKYEPKSISIIVSEPSTNKIIALENFPRFNSNSPREGRTEEEQDILSNLAKDEKLDKFYEIWRNIAISDVYEPGSVFKLITTAIALEEGTSNEDSTYICKGIYDDIPGVKIKCISWYDPHGVQTLKEALANSCNPSYVQIAKEIGNVKFYNYTKAFGFGTKTGIDLVGEENGIIPKTVNDINITELATMSYGHGISVTPIQMITAANAVVNGGYLIEPRIVDINNEENKVVKRQVISEETSKKMRDLLENVVNNGNGNRVKAHNYRVGGKSGTTIKIENGIYTSEKTITSFYSTFPIDNPKYSVLVVVDEPKGENTGNAVAGSISKNINDEIVKLKNLEDKNYSKIGITQVEVPNLIGESLKNAIKILRANELKGNILNTSLNEFSKLA